MTALQVLQLVVIGWMPGAAIFRLPWLDRDRRAGLPAEERLFWAIVISLAISLSLVLVLAAAGQYSLGRLLAANAGLAACAAAAARLDLRLGPAARRPGLSILLPLMLVALGSWRFFPPAEYVIGGKDPGVYIAEGIQIAQRGTFAYDDPVVSTVPPFARDLFFPSHEREEYYGLRFMGFFIMDPERGTVVGQFPHLFPASIAIGYGLDGLSGARRAVGVWAVLGLLAVYFAGAQLAGRAAAWSASVLLALHVVQVWFARYPNAEVVMQAFLFAALLALARSHHDRDTFFAPVAGLLLGLLFFLRVDAALSAMAVVIAIALLTAAGERRQTGVVVVLGACAVLAALYLLGPMRAYAERPILFLTHNVFWWHYLAGAALAAVVLALVLVSARNPALSTRVRGLAPVLVTAIVVLGAVYALYFREPAGKLAPYDAYALRDFTRFYLSNGGLLAALAGFMLLARHSFWRAPALFITVAVFALFFFYKIRIVPEHFWAARRFVPVILPGALLFACAAATWGLRQSGARRIVSAAIGAVFILLLGGHYARAARPVADHLEYAGIIPELESLAGSIGADDLLLVESRDAGSDAHVFALPLAYIYARPVLVLASARPDREAFGTFLEWARTRYGAVYFLGGGGTELLARDWSAKSVASRRFQVPEYESAWSAFPRVVRRKEFDFGLYQLLPAAADPGMWFDLDVGIHDDLHVTRFHAKEETDGRTFRWSQRQSFVALPALPDAGREVVIDMSAGGRPHGAPAADVTVHLDEYTLGTAVVADGFQSYTFAIPDTVRIAVAGSGRLARLRLVTSVWNPRQVLGTGDDRELGVMVDRVQVR